VRGLGSMIAAEFCDPATGNPTLPPHNACRRKPLSKDCCC
jgi:hypothetical protein